MDICARMSQQYGYNLTMVKDAYKLMKRDDQLLEETCKNYKLGKYLNDNHERWKKLTRVGRMYGRYEKGTNKNVSR